MTVVEGIRTTIPLHLKILNDPDFIAGRLSTHFMERFCRQAQDAQPAALRSSSLSLADGTSVCPASGGPRSTPSSTPRSCAPPAARRSTSARAFLAAGARLLQLRCKAHGRAAPFLDLADARCSSDARPRGGAMLIVNDRADIAALAGRRRRARRARTTCRRRTRGASSGATPIVGLSTHTREQWSTRRCASRSPTWRSVRCSARRTKDTGYDGGRPRRGRARPPRRPRRRRCRWWRSAASRSTTRRAVIDAGAASVAVISDLLKATETRRRACRSRIPDSTLATAVRLL